MTREGHYRKDSSSYDGQSDGIHPSDRYVAGPKV
jgi:hypothetical protein